MRNNATYLLPCHVISSPDELRRIMNDPEMITTHDSWNGKKDKTNRHVQKAIHELSNRSIKKGSWKNRLCIMK